MNHGSNRNGHRRRRGVLPLLALVVWALLATAGPTAMAPAPRPAAAQTAAQVDQTVDAAIEARQAAQRELDRWESERADLVARYRTAQANGAYLQERCDIERASLAALEERIDELQRRIGESARLESSLEDTLRTLLRRLDESVAHSLPFLPEERSSRLAALRRELVDPEVTGAEKLRRLLEALQIEAQYGGTVEVYQDRITVGGEPIHADILRLGRLALFWLTPDGRRAGRYDEAAGQWVELPSKYRRALQRTVEMVTRLRPADLVELPIGRVAP